MKLRTDLIWSVEFAPLAARRVLFHQGRLQANQALACAAQTKAQSVPALARPMPQATRTKTPTPKQARQIRNRISKAEEVKKPAICS